MKRTFVSLTYAFVSFPEIRIPEVQERVADAVNNIVKHFYKPEKEVRSTYLFLIQSFGWNYSKG